MGVSRSVRRGGRGPRSSVWLASALVGITALAAGCGLVPGLQEPAPPRFGPMGGDEDLQPIGPVVEIGRGESLGISWRYSVHESAIGTCTTVESDGQLGGMSCGGALGPEPPGGALGVMSVGSGTGSPSTVDGFAADEVAEVWIRLENGGRVQAALMPLAPAGMQGHMFYAVVPAGRAMREVVALGEDGEELASQPLDHP